VGGCNLRGGQKAGRKSDEFVFHRLWITLKYFYFELFGYNFIKTNIVYIQNVGCMNKRHGFFETSLKVH
jgi:hypothetical protein